MPQLDRNIYIYINRVTYLNTDHYQRQVYNITDIFICHVTLPCMYKFNAHFVCSFPAALKISRDSHLPIQLLELEMECTENLLERCGNK